MMTDWLPAATELDAYEGIRRGDERAFRAVAGQLQPVLRGLAGIYLNPPVADDIVVRGWELALGGLDMFRWNTSLATWLAKSTVAAGRAADRHRETVVLAPPSGRVPTTTHDGPPDWSDLPWSARWEGVAWPVLHNALAALPCGQREIVHGRDVERWPARRVCDVFGVPEVVYGHLLLDARIRLCNAIGRCVGQTGPGPHDDARITAITGMLGLLHQDAKEPLDARVLTVFRRWRAARRTGWRRVVSLPMRAASW